MTYSFSNNKSILKFDSKMFDKIFKFPNIYTIEKSTIYSKKSDNTNEQKVLVIVDNDFFQKYFSNLFASQDIQYNNLTISSKISQGSPLHNNSNKFVNDFHLITSIGKGGFGRVYSAKNKIDLQIYAVKKVDIDNSKFCEKTIKDIFKEFRILAKLNHGNIVRYHTAWLEQLPELDTESNAPHSNSSRSSSTFPSNAMSSSDTNMWRPSSVFGTSAISSSDINRSDISQLVRTSSCNLSRNGNFSSCHKSSKEMISRPIFPSADIVFESSSNHRDQDNTSNNSTNQISLSYSLTNVDGALERYRKDFPFVSKPQFGLFIQMELCQINLRDWLDARNQSNESKYLNDINQKRARSLARQLLKGMKYLHENGVIHRDIKPANIFLSTQTHEEFDLQSVIQLKIGDFGLAKSFEYNSNDRNANLTANVGTAFYSAPEVCQFKRRRGYYNHKSDLYSMGIVLLELIWKFCTVSELCRTVTDLSNGIMCNDILDSWILEAPIIMSLVSTKPDTRPEASFLLRETFCFKEDLVKSGLYDFIKDLTHENSRLKSEVQSLRTENDALRLLQNSSEPES